MLRKAATSGSAKFFLGTDSAPHTAEAKESSCGCAGIFTAANALELYLQVFDEENALSNFEAFASINGPSFYNMPKNKGVIKFHRKMNRVQDKIYISKDEYVTPFLAGSDLNWSIAETEIDA